MGQICRLTPLGKIAQKISGYSRTLSSCLLLAIVYNVFSDTFSQGIGVSGGSLGRLIATMPAVYMLLSGIFWELSKKLLPGLDSKTRSAALFCSSQKTLAFGIPFIKTALGSRPDIAYILAPLLMYAPAQLFLGSSILVPAMLKLNKRGQEFAQGGGI
jgi:sodium/bile acid cotransporter 7